ncbi:hypothetical protein QYE76_024790 [Lolium multiflorum]|uniref:Uncharacterized protein n=1 Tax=Lolium multiflorum TaxID=4521 RepID=A0AAD8RHC1_LOLMU|nr:hypothetical protein QYE76_024790 [Lolium multiflorum]
MDGVKLYDDYFCAKVDAIGKVGLSSYQKCTTAIRMLAYGVAGDFVDEYTRMSESTCLEAMYVLQSSDRAYNGHSGGCTVILEAVASHDTWICHSFFGMAGSHNDINVLQHSPVFDGLAYAHPKLSTPPETEELTHRPPPPRRPAHLPYGVVRRRAAPPPPPPPGSASTRSRSTPFAEFVCPSGVPTVPVSRGEDWDSEGSNAWIPSGSTAAPSVPSASGSQIVRTVDVEDDADIEDQSPQDDEDELMFPELVDRCSKQTMEDQYMEDIAFGARFDETDDEEKNENDDNLILADYVGEDLPTIEWNREDPQLAEGTVFQTMMDCCNAITTYHILTKNDYEVIKSEPDKEE